MQTNDHDFITLLGSIDCAVRKADGTPEMVKILQLKIRYMPQLLAAQQNEPRLVELFCGKEHGWADTLTFESFVEVLEKGEELNAANFSAWNARRVKRDARLPQRSTEETMELIAALQKTNPELLQGLLQNAGLASPPSSPGSPTKLG